jgi:hypothetical protein
MGRHSARWDNGRGKFGHAGRGCSSCATATMTQSTHACCWAAGDESEPLWRLYCTDDGPCGVGIALRTTLAKLEASIEPHDLYVSPVTYRHYHEGPAFDDELDRWQRQGRRTKAAARPNDRTAISP